jgi:hypothetical protein
MIKKDEIIGTWEISSFIDFIQKFHLEEQVLKDFDGIKDIQDVYESKDFTDDNSNIAYYLEEIKDRMFDMQFIEVRNNNYWVITEYKPIKDKIKHFMEVLGQYPKVVNPDEIYYPYSSIEATLKEVL